MDASCHVHVYSILNEACSYKEKPRDRTDCLEKAPHRITCTCYSEESTSLRNLLALHGVKSALTGGDRATRTALVHFFLVLLVPLLAVVLFLARLSPAEPNAFFSQWHEYIPRRLTIFPYSHSL